VIGVRHGRDGQQQIVAKPVGGPAWRATSRGEIDGHLLNRLADVAVSPRHFPSLVKDFGIELSTVELDVVVLLDFTDPLAAESYRRVVKRVEKENVIRGLHTSGVRLQVLLPSLRQHTLTDAAVEILREEASSARALTDHTIIFHPSNIDSLSLSPAELSAVAGRALGSLLALESDNPIRALFTRLPDAYDWRMRFWSLGMAHLRCDGAGLVRHVKEMHSRFLRRAWAKRNWQKERIQHEARAVVARLVDSDTPAAELPQRLALWAAGFFLDEHSQAGSSAPTPADLSACLAQVVNELCFRSQQIAADLPNFRIHSPRPVDPRGWFKKFLNWLSFRRLFRWKCRWDPPTDIPKMVAARRARLASLDHIVMNSQIAVGMALHDIENGSWQPSSEGEINLWPGASWDSELVRKADSKVNVDEKALAEAILDGRSVMDIFQHCFLKAIGISADMQGWDLIAEVGRAMGGRGDMPLQILHSLTQRAAPWWAEPIDPRTEVHKFICMPKSGPSAIEKAKEHGFHPVAWHQESYGAFNLLQGTVPQQLAQALVVQEDQLQRSSRDWIPTAAVRSRAD